MVQFTIGNHVPRMKMDKSGTLREGFETEFTSVEFNTTQTVWTPTDDPLVVRTAILARLENLRKIYALGAVE